MSRSDVVPYLRCHRFGSAGAVIVVVTAIAFSLSATKVSLPAATSAGSVSAPIWIYLELPIAVSIIAVEHSGMSEFEQASPGGERLVGAVSQSVLALGALLLFAGSFVLLGKIAFAVGALRNLIFWGAMASLSARAFGAGAAWLLPLCLVFPVVWFGSSPSGLPRWWAVPLLGPESLWSWSLCALTVGVAGIVRFRGLARSVLGKCAASFPFRKVRRLQ